MFAYTNIRTDSRRYCYNLDYASPVFSNNHMVPTWRPFGYDGGCTAEPKGSPGINEKKTSWTFRCHKIREPVFFLYLKPFLIQLLWYHIVQVLTQTVEICWTQRPCGIKMTSFTRRVEITERLIKNIT